MNFDKVFGEIVIDGLGENPEEKVTTFVIALVKAAVLFRVIQRGNDYVIQFNGGF